MFSAWNEIRVLFTLIHRIEFISEILYVDFDSLYITNSMHMSLKASWNCRSNTACECPWNFWINSSRVFLCCPFLTWCSLLNCLSLDIRSGCYILDLFSIHRIEIFSEILSVDLDSPFITDSMHMSLKGSWNCRSNTAHECLWNFWIDAFRVFLFCSSLIICSSLYLFRLRCDQGVTYTTFFQPPPSCSIDFNPLPPTDPNSVRIRATHHPNCPLD